MTSRWTEPYPDLLPVPVDSWRRNAACLDADPTVFDVNTRAPGWQDRARQVAHRWCRTCSVLEECRTDPWTAHANGVIQAGRFQSRTAREPIDIDLLNDPHTELGGAA